MLRETDQITNYNLLIVGYILLTLSIDPFYPKTDRQQSKLKIEERKHLH